MHEPQFGKRERERERMFGNVGERAEMVCLSCLLSRLLLLSLDGLILPCGNPFPDR